MKTTQKGVSWMDLIEAIGPGETEEFPIEKRNSIAPLISSRIKDRYPSRKYKVHANHEGGKLEVTRLIN